MIQSRTMSVSPFVCLKLKISVTAKPIGFYSSLNIPTGPVVGLGCFFRGSKTKFPLPLLGPSPRDFTITLMVKPLESRGEAAGII